MSCKSPPEFCFPLAVILFATAMLSGCSITGFLTSQGLGLTPGEIAGGVPATSPDTAILENTGTPQELLKSGEISAVAGFGLTENERKAALKAEFEALEYSPTGHPVGWRSASTGNYGEVTAFQTYDVGTANCRKYTHRLTINGKLETASGAACKEQDGTWEPLT